jgi:hypothetical protein
VIQVDKKNANKFEIRYFETGKPVKNYTFTKSSDGSYETSEKISAKLHGAIVNCIILSNFAGK